MAKNHLEQTKWKLHIFRMRNKQGGWHNRRFGKNPRWSNPTCDAYRKELRSKNANHDRTA